MDLQETAAQVPAVIPKEEEEKPTSKPKRVLTEAQLLALEKGRERKRIEREVKRQEKADAIAEESTPIETQESSPPKEPAFSDELVEAIASRVALKIRPPTPAKKPRAPRKKPVKVTITPVAPAEEPMPAKPPTPNSGFGMAKFKWV